MKTLTTAQVNYIYALTNASWVKDLTSTTLSKEFMEKYGLKGSPKLSKQLLSLGLSKQQVSFCMDIQNLDYKLWENGESSEIVVRLQGNSTHFKSCQAVANPYDENDWTGVDSYRCKVLEDKIAYEKGYLSFITFGNPITKDGKGWTSRAKLRNIYNSKDEIVGLYLDCGYGNLIALMQAATQIAISKGLWLIASAKTYPGRQSYFDWQQEYIPSVNYGYQDSCNYNNTDEKGVWLVKPKRKDKNFSLISSVYNSRKKVGGVYSTPVVNGLFNPQTGKVIGDYTSHNHVYRALKRMLPKPMTIKKCEDDLTFIVRKNAESKYFICFYQYERQLTYTFGQYQIKCKVYGRDTAPVTTVIKDDPENGYLKAVVL